MINSPKQNLRLMAKTIRGDFISSKDQHDLHELEKNRIASLWAHPLLKDLFAQNRPLVFGLYKAIGTEASTDLLRQHILKSGHHVALPRLDGDQMTFKDASKDMDLEISEFGFQQLSKEAETLHKIDVLIVPLLAFDDRGNRLGYGKGHYDRYLSTLTPMPLLMGWAYPCQHHDRLPVDPHDIPLDAVIT